MTSRLQRINKILYNTSIYAQQSQYDDNILSIILKPTHFPKSKAILEEQPIIFVPTIGFCQSCGRPSMIFCNKCNHGWCSITCKDQDCFKHFMLCQLERGIADLVFYILKTSFRQLVISKSINNAIMVSLELFGQYTKPQNLLRPYNLEMILERFTDFQTLFNKFENDFYIDSDLSQLKKRIFSDELIQYIYSIYMTRKIPIMNDNQQMIGDGLYQISSMINHNCRATSKISFDNLKIQLYRVVDNGNLTLDFKNRGDLKSQGIECFCEDCQE
ncbi:hypothetical protein SS50377_23439 [Spironucleus salmonicida]|uniref:SET domain-containing protein n=1 Tax=Spironucleus salmonicida TaxID=348837 RepID=V6LR67_9EUKA|nr:hypothetical protein SS50377_23439 [Spironucleus salmonicida]|eukprot:EST46176.1 Hypothetical protein SS50377_13770 [Spironucleus salmonicida]